MITEHRDLRTGRTYWQAQPAPKVSMQVLDRDIETDVLIVGAGISGAVIAEAVSGKHRVVMLDRRAPVAGSTTASTALIQYEVDVPLIHLSEQIGEEQAARAWLRSHRSLQNLLARTRSLGIECDLADRESLYLSGEELDAGAMRTEAEARNDIGLETQYLTATELGARYGIAREAALRSAGDFSADPRRLALGYLREAQQRGAEIFGPAEVTEVATVGDRLAASTGAGPVIRASVIVFATGFELPRWIPLDGHRIVSTYAVATVRQTGRLWRNEALISEACDPYLYLRSTPDGRVICGGEDEDIDDEDARDALIGKKSATIAAKLKRLMPHLDVTLDFAWAGAFGASDTGLPSIGEVPGIPNCWSVHGFGGNGMNYCRIAAEIIAAALDGENDPDADLFAFRAKPA